MNAKEIETIERRARKELISDMLKITAFLFLPTIWVLAIFGVFSR